MYTFPFSSSSYTPSLFFFLFIYLLFPVACAFQFIPLLTLPSFLFFLFILSSVPCYLYVSVSFLASHTFPFSSSFCLSDLLVAVIYTFPFLYRYTFPSFLFLSSYLLIAVVCTFLFLPYLAIPSLFLPLFADLVLSNLIILVCFTLLLFTLPLPLPKAFILLLSFLCYRAFFFIVAYFFFLLFTLLFLFLKLSLS